MLGGLVDLADARVLDLFAGSGSFGLECLSRGAGSVTFVERSRSAQLAIEANLDALGFTDRATVLSRSVESVLVDPDHPGNQLNAYELVFCDPPYAEDPWAKLFAGAPAPVLVGHAAHDIDLGDGWGELRRRRYGRARILIAQRTGDTRATL